MKIVDPSRAVLHSVVVPFYNEVECAPALVQRIAATMRGVGVPFEIIAVDDGSLDGTDAAICALPEMTELVLLRFTQNQGQAAALLEGMREASGEILITLDGDGQNPPEEIPRLLARLPEADMVAGVRANRQDSGLRRRISRLANAVRSRVLHDGVRDSGCGLKVFRREVVQAFIPMRTLYSFMPALAAAAGFRIVEQEVRHEARTLGESKYNLRIFLWKPLLDMLGLAWFIRRRYPALIVRTRTPSKPSL